MDSWGRRDIALLGKYAVVIGGGIVMGGFDGGLGAAVVVGRRVQRWREKWDGMAEVAIFDERGGHALLEGL